MTLEDLKNYIETLGLAEHVYMGKMPGKQDESIGVYNSKHSHGYQTAIGGHELKSYGTKYATFLIHWNKSQRETEKVAVSLFEAIQQAREVTVNDATIKMIQPLTDGPVPVDTDENGIFEMVIEAAVIYAKKGKGE